MSASYFDLLKYAATGQASPSMTYFDKMRASTLMGGAVQTLTGQPPLSFKSDGSPLISWSMKGNGVQSGTPTPDNPVMPEFVGVRTANLAPPYSDWVNGYIDNSTGGISPQTASLKEKTSDFISVEPSTSYTFSRFPEGTQGAWRVVGKYDENKEFIGRSGGAGSTALTFTTTADTKYVRVCCRTYGSTDYSMLNSGSTVLPFEPFGWAEKITCGGETTPVYLGQVSTVRRIKKLVLTGNEDWSFAASDTNRTVCDIFLKSCSGNFLCCSHIEWKSAYSTGEYNRIVWVNTAGGTLFVSIENTYLSSRDVAGFKSYLAQQYAAGNPVTVWYVLATPTTGIVNEPLAKIGDYVDELHSIDAGVTIPTAKGSNTLTVESELQPSEMTVTYRG